MKVLAEISIKLLADGNVTVHGPFHDKVLSYGLLGVAKDEIAKFHAQAGKVVLAPASVTKELQHG